MADATRLRNMNTELVRHALRSGSAMSKNDLARETGLSFPTVSRTVDQLVLLGEIREAGAAASTGGRCAQQYMRDPHFRVMLCARLENGRLHYAVRDLDGAVVQQGEQQHKTSVLQMLYELASRMRQQYPNLGSVVLGVDCAVHDGKVSEDAAYADLRGLDLAGELTARCGALCIVMRDIFLAAMGCCVREGWLDEVVVAIHLSASGMQAGLVMNGQVFAGASSFAGALHYLPIKHNLDYAKTQFAGADMTAYYMQVIRAYAALVNPKRVVLYHNPLLQGRLERIRYACAQTLPAQALPELVVSDAFDADYDAGLWDRANKITEDRIHELLYL